MIRERGVPGFAAAWLFVFMSLVCSLSVAAQSAPSSPVSQPPSAQNPSDKKTDQPSDSAPTRAPAPPKKSRVITNDDIKADRIRHNDGFAGGQDLRESPVNGDCDDECADQAREMAGFNEDQEGDWRFALTAARRNLATDRAWPGAYATLARAVKAYCTYQQQVQQAAVPTGSDYGSRVERAKRQKYVEDMTRVLRQNIDNANAQIERMAQQAGDTDEPARGAIMRVLAQRVIDSCQ